MRKPKPTPWQMNTAKLGVGIALVIVFGLDVYINWHIISDAADARVGQAFPAAAPCPAPRVDPVGYWVEGL